MIRVTRIKGALVTGLMTALFLIWGIPAHAVINGVTGTTFNFVAKQGQVLLGDGSSVYMWGYALDTGGPMQFPGPTVILNQGVAVTVRLRNLLPAAAGNVSIVFPGHQVTATGGVQGLLTREAPPDGTTVTYTFTPGNAGTYPYFSGTKSDLQVEMGLGGAIIVRPTGFNPASPRAYNHSASSYDREYLYYISDMDPRIHVLAQQGQFDMIDTTTFFSTAWFVNGRTFPDTLSDANVPWLPNQPYNCQPLMHPGEKVLIRTIGHGRELHPMHYHGNDFAVIAQDGRLLESNPGVSGPDLQWNDNTIRVNPGQTADFIWTWTGEKLGWDVYGHLPGDPQQPNEYGPDHGKPFPVIIPGREELALGPFWSGSPFLGGSGELPPSHPGLNAAGAFFFMWHSHTEKEITNIGLFPGGLITFMIIEHPSVPIP